MNDRIIYLLERCYLNELSEIDSALTFQKYPSLLFNYLESTLRWEKNDPANEVADTSGDYLENIPSPPQTPRSITCK